MAKHSTHILELARKGAEHKYEELKTEIEILVHSFPHLAARTRHGLSKALARSEAVIESEAKATLKRGRKAIKAAMEEIKPRKRRKMSAAARAKISAAQKARWAKQKAKSAKT